MDSALKQRLIGAAVLVALAMIFLPMLLKGPDTAEPASARNSRWRLTAAWMRRPNKTPIQPIAIKASPRSGSGFLSLLLRLRV